jgi:hypothetical protein
VKVKYVERKIEEKEFDNNLEKFVNKSEFDEFECKFLK